MNAPQVIMICLLALSLGIGIAEHGKARSPHNIVADLISTALLVGLLAWGGFWN